MKLIHFLFLCFLPFPSLASSKKNIFLMIHSYNTDYRLTVDQDRGAVKAFYKSGIKRKEDWRIERIYLDSKKRNTRELAKYIRRAKAKILKLKPKAIMLTDDFAFKYLFKFINERDIPFTFSGINGNLKDYGYHPGTPGISGTLERYNYLGILSLVKKIRPKIQNLVVVSEKNITGQALLRDFEKQVKNRKIKRLGLKVKIFTDSRFDHLKSFLKKVNDQNTAVFVMSIYAKKSKNGEYVDHSLIDRWILNHTQFIDLGLSFFQVKGGRLMSIASSMVESGFFSSKILFDSLETGKNLNQYPLRKKLPLKLTLNHIRAKKIGLKFPFDVLIYADSVNKIKASR